MIKMSETKAYYKTCVVCSQQFSVRYFNRHVCAGASEEDLIADSVGYDHDPVDEIAEMNFCDKIENLEEERKQNLCEEHDKNSISEESSNDDDSDDDSADDAYVNKNGNFADDFFNDLLDESLFDDSFTDINFENLPVNIFLQWITLFLAKWQKAFNITDSSLQLLLKFLALFIHTILSEKLEDKFIEKFKKEFPKTIYSFQKSLSIDTLGFEKYTVCIKCNSLYPINDCVIRRGGNRVSKECSFVKFPDHPQSQHRRKCGQLLMKPLPSVANKFVPFKTYCYQSIKSSLEVLLKRPDFEGLCEMWRERSIPEKILADVFDGSIWKTFSKNGNWFFDSPRNYGLMLNCDWFQPFKHISSFSVGAIYAVILNLPRHIRFKRENVILVGIIPDMPKEPPTNSFLEPFIDELRVAWTNGFQLFSTISGKEEIFHLALLCVGCDIPASRKICGFLGHSASRGCSKCNKLFPGQVGEKNYGGFDMSTWVCRTNQEHRNQMMNILSAKTQQDQNQLESQYGTRFSVLALLPYFDAVRMNVVDPMHNLFLGTAKHLVKIWKEKGYLNKAALQEIQRKADSFVVPFDIGKVPRKIISGFDNFNADEYKNWTILFSLYSLTEIIPKHDLECFRKFVLACNYLCRKSISASDVTISHELLVKFCKSFENLYGEERVTPNMHLHLHLKDCIMDYGPIYSFWLFSFERYNGMLGRLPHNKRNIELQIMSRFCGEGLIDNIETPTSHNHIFNEIFKQLEAKNIARGTLHDMECQSTLQIGKLSSRLTDVSGQLWYIYSEVIQPLKELKVCAFTQFEKETLMEVYQCLYPHIGLDADSFCHSYEQVHDIKILESRYSSSSSRNGSSSFIMAYWPKMNGNIAKYEEIGLLPHPGRIKYFIKHSLIVENKNYEHWFAAVDWFLPVDDNIRFKFGKPIEVWYRSLTIQYGPASFIPVSRIYCKFIHSKYEYRSKDLMVVIPRIYTTSSVV